MGAFFDDPSARLVLWLAVIAALLALGAYFVSLVRRWYREEPPGTSDMMTSFRDLYCQGELSDEEYQSIKSKLANRFQNELKDAGEKG